MAADITVARDTFERRATLRLNGRVHILREEYPNYHLRTPGSIRLEGWYPEDDCPLAEPVSVLRGGQALAAFASLLEEAMR